MSIRIQTYPRIHITLIGMNEGGVRRHGGIGFSISSPLMNINGSESDEFKLIDNRRINLEAQEYYRLKKSIENFFVIKKFNKKIALSIEGELIPHLGFGSETALRLASLEILSLINDHPVDKDELIYFSGRGGVSGIGINTYFHGGFVFDAGVKNDLIEFKPSNLSEARSALPLLIKGVNVEKWELGIYLDSEISSLSEEAELKFFKGSCPISNQDTYEILYFSVYECLSAIIQQDKNAFINSINQIQKTKWKSLERNLYNGLIEKSENLLFSSGAAAVGMSSLGPMLYFFSDRPIENVIKKAISIGMRGKFYSSLMNNSGRVIQYE